MPGIASLWSGALISGEVWGGWFPPTPWALDGDPEPKGFSGAHAALMPRVTRGSQPHDTTLACARLSEKFSEEEKERVCTSPLCRERVRELSPPPPARHLQPSDRSEDRRCVLGRGTLPQPPAPPCPTILSSLSLYHNPKHLNRAGEASATVPVGL